MVQYINKSAVVAEIKNRISDIEVSQKAGLIKKSNASMRIVIFKSILSFLDALEVKEVDLKKAHEETIEIPFGAKDSELCGFEYTIPEDMEGYIENGKIGIRKKEKNKPELTSPEYAILRYLQNGANAKFDMTDKEKARELARRHQGTMTDAQYLQMTYALEEMVEWKDKKLDFAIDKALQRNGEFLKQGKITQYGYDLAFATIQNIREFQKMEE